MVAFVIAVGTPTITDVVNGHPEAGGCSIRRDGNSESSNDDLPVDEPASHMECQTQAPEC